MTNLKNTSKFQIKQGDTNVPLVVQLSNEDGYINLVGCTVKFLMTDWKKQNVIVDDVAILEYDDKGIVSYFFNESQIQKIGSYFCQFEITFPNGKKEFYPTSGNIILTVNPNLRGEIEIPEVDVTPPQDVTDLGYSEIGIDRVSLSWSMSVSNDVKFYNVYKDGNHLLSVSSPNCVITGLSSGTTYEFIIRSVDYSDNLSGGVSIQITTLTQEPPVDDEAWTYDFVVDQSQGTYSLKNDLSWTHTLTLQDIYGANLDGLNAKAKLYTLGVVDGTPDVAQELPRKTFDGFSKPSMHGEFQYDSDIEQFYFESMAMNPYYFRLVKSK